MPKYTRRPNREADRKNPNQVKDFAVKRKKLGTGKKEAASHTKLEFVTRGTIHARHAE